MGTHPIFESDFDCLTDGTVKTRRSRSWTESVAGQKEPLDKNRILNETSHQYSAVQD